MKNQIRDMVKNRSFPFSQIHSTFTYCRIHTRIHRKRASSPPHRILKQSNTNTLHNRMTTSRIDSSIDRESDEEHAEEEEHNNGIATGIFLEDSSYNSDNSATTSPPLSVSVWRYLSLLQRNSGYRWYFVSHVCQDVGDWFVKIGAVLTIQKLSKTSEGSAIAYLMLTIMLPQLFLSPIGGLLADSFDRRNLMLVLDVLSGTVVFGYLVALHYESVPLLYLVSTVRTSISSLYDPITRSILPMIVRRPLDLKRAVSVNYLAWSAMRILGGLIAGYSSAYLGIGTCFVIDSITYYVSALALFRLKGNFSVVPAAATATDGNNNNNSGRRQRRGGPSSCLCSVCGLLREQLEYLWGLGCVSVMVLLRTSGAAIWGWADVLNVTYSHVPGDEAETSRHLGILMSFLGLGCLVGPPIANVFTNPNQPQKIQGACIGGMGIMTLGWIGIWASPASFWRICAFSALRTLGAAVLITNSTLLMQRVIDSEYLGRVLSLDYCLSMGMDSFTNWMAGHLQDQDFTKEQIAGVAILIGAGLFGLWTLYHLTLGGAERLEDEHLIQIIEPIAFQTINSTEEEDDEDDGDEGRHSDSKSEVELS